MRRKPISRYHLAEIGRGVPDSPKVWLCCLFSSHIFLDICVLPTVTESKEGRGTLSLESFVNKHQQPRLVQSVQDSYQRTFSTQGHRKKLEEAVTKRQKVYSCFSRRQRRRTAFGNGQRQCTMLHNQSVVPTESSSNVKTCSKCPRYSLSLSHQSKIAHNFLLRECFLLMGLSAFVYMNYNG